MNDVLLGLNAAGGASLEDLLDFAKSAPDLQFPRDVARFPCAVGQEEGRGSANSSVKDVSRKPARAAEPRPQYVPDFLPPFPDPCTYRRTATHNKRAMDPLQARKQRAKLKRQAQESLLGLQQGGGASCSADGFCGAAASTAAPPPAPLPSLRPAAASTEETVGDGVSDGGGGAAGSRLVPDVLVPGVAAVLQSSAASECGGLQAASAVPARAHAGATRGAAATAGATGSSAKRTKQERPRVFWRVCSGACVTSRHARAAPCPPLTRASLPPRAGGHPRSAAPARPGRGGARRTSRRRRWRRGPARVTRGDGGGGRGGGGGGGGASASSRPQLTRSCIVVVSKRVRAVDRRLWPACCLAVRIVRPVVGFAGVAAPLWVQQVCALGRRNQAHSEQGERSHRAEAWQPTRRFAQRAALAVRLPLPADRSSLLR